MTIIEKQTVLIVDDSTENIDVLNGILNDSYNIKFAKSGKMAIKIAEKFQPDIILLDIMMPEMDGYEVCEKLKLSPVTTNIPIIFVSAKDQELDEAKGFELGAVDYITKPVSPVIVKARVRTQLSLMDQQLELSKQVKEKTKELVETRLEIINKLSVAAEYKDTDTGLHVTRMSKYCYIMAQEYGFNEEAAELLLNASPMHDVGKIGIPDHILEKPAKLDSDEWEVMMTHCQIGKDILGDNENPLLKIASIVALQHHEKWNGKGYPNGLSGVQIDINARITAVADVFDALTSDRPYKKAWEVEKAVSVIQEDSGTHFDPKVVEVFLKSLDKILDVKNTYSSF